MKTKKVHGVDLPSRCFAYVGNSEDTSSWHCCIHVLGDPAKTINAVRMALARFSETKGIPEGEKSAVWHKIVGAALCLGVRVEERAKSEAPAPAAESAQQVQVIKPKPEPKVRTVEEIEFDRVVEEAVAMADAKATLLLRSLGLE